MNNWREIYQSKLTTANEAIKFIHDGDKVVTGFGCGEPFGIERALVENYENYHDVEIISMLTLGDSPWCRPEMKGHFKLNCLFASQSNRKAISLGVSEFTTSHFYEIPDLIKNYICPKVAIVMVSPPDEHGYVSFGTTVDYTRGTADYCDIIIAQVNKYMPRTFGNSFMHVRDFTCFVECNEPLPEVKSVDISETEMEIGKYCASLIKDGDCLQLGIGGIPNAVCAQLWAKKDLGLHSELVGQVVSDTVGLNQYSAVGGQVDFVRGATMSKGGRSIIAMPSTAKKGLISRIVPLITEGSAVTTPRNDVNYVVTEYGIAQLKGKTLKERAKALIRIAHPKFRPHLILEYKKRYNEEPFTSEEMQTQFKDYLSETKESIKDGVASLISKIKE